MSQGTHGASGSGKHKETAAFRRHAVRPSWFQPTETTPTSAEQEHGLPPDIPLLPCVRAAASDSPRGRGQSEHPGLELLSAVISSLALGYSSGLSRSLCFFLLCKRSVAASMQTGVGEGEVNELACKAQEGLQHRTCSERSTMHTRRKQNTVSVLCISRGRGWSSPQPQCWGAELPHTSDSDLAIPAAAGPKHTKLTHTSRAPCTYSLEVTLYTTSVPPHLTETGHARSSVEFSTRGGTSVLSEVLDLGVLQICRLGMLSLHPSFL